VKEKPKSLHANNINNKSIKHHIKHDGKQTWMHSMGSSGKAAKHVY